MNNTAQGTFDVTITPQTQNDATGSSLGSMTLDKVFHGDLNATSVGMMITAHTSVGSAVYSAIERVSGTLHERMGSFVLQHTGLMTSNNQELTIRVVPDSGSDQLVGISGTMQIIRDNGTHGYVFEYELAD